MTWNPQNNDPYNPPHDQFGPPGGQFDPYGHPPQQGTNLTWLWVLLGVGGGMAFLCCGGCLILGFIGLGQEEVEIQAKIEGRPAIEEYIGSVESVERDWSKSLDEDDDDIWIFRIVGDKGEGDLIVKEVPGLEFEEEINIEWAKLQLDTGEEFDVLP